MHNYLKGYEPKEIMKYKINMLVSPQIVCDVDYKKKLTMHRSIIYISINDRSNIVLLYLIDAELK